MGSIGTGYDLSVTTFSPDGRVFQIEYATKAVDNSGTVIGIKCKDGIVLGVEKLIASKMLLEGSNRRIHAVHRHAGMAVAGLAADGRQIVARAKSEATSYEGTYGEPIPVKELCERVASYVHLCTLYWWLRPFGSGVILGGYDREGPQLYMIEPSGVAYRYFGAAIGKGRQGAKTTNMALFRDLLEIEKLKLSEMTCREGVIEVAKMTSCIKDELENPLVGLQWTFVPFAVPHGFASSRDLTIHLIGGAHLAETDPSYLVHPFLSRTCAPGNERPPKVIERFPGLLKNDEVGAILKFVGASKSNLEYEATIQGLKMISKLGSKKVLIQGDSSLLRENFIKSFLFKRLGEVISFHRVANYGLDASWLDTDTEVQSGVASSTILVDLHLVLKCECLWISCCLNAGDNVKQEATMCILKIHGGGDPFYELSHHGEALQTITLTNLHVMHQMVHSTTWERYMLKQFKALKKTMLSLIKVVLNLPLHVGGKKSRRKI
eukprot:Gb_03944 [translate_table: standard]